MRRAHSSATRRLLTIALAVLVCGLACPAAIFATGGAAGDVTPPERCRGAVRVTRRTVTLHLVDRAALSPEVRDELTREAVRPWREAGVDVRWASADAVSSGGPEDVYVIVKRDADGAAAGVGGPWARPIAAILFVDGAPTTQVSAYVSAVERLAAQVRLDDQTWFDHPRLQRQRLVGRALGRAIAHEIGHYLFASAAHALGGLMRAQHPIERLLTSSGAGFRVITP
jgi:hypothetical protein